MKKRGCRAIILKVILLVLSILYVSFLYVDVAGADFFISSTGMKYICIILCFIISLLIGKDGLGRGDTLLLQLGLFFTVIADLFLLVLSYHTLGVATFYIVQTCYSIRYQNDSAYKIIKRNFLILIVIITIHLIVNVFIVETKVLFTIAFFYAILLINNTIEAIRACKDDLFPYPNKYMIVWGMVLFLLCDINVALFNITKNNYISSVLIWFFYLPSQVLLALSGWKGDALIING